MEPGPVCAIVRISGIDGVTQINKSSGINAVNAVNAVDRVERNRFVDSLAVLERTHPHRGRAACPRAIATQSAAGLKPRAASARPPLVETAGPHR